MICIDIDMYRYLFIMNRFRLDNEEKKTAIRYYCYYCRY